MQTDKTKAHQKAYRESHKEEIKERNKAYRESHKEEMQAYQKVYGKSHTTKLKAYSDLYRESNKEKIKERDKAYNESNKEVLKEKRKEYYELNKEYIKERNKTYNALHKEEIKEYYESHKEDVKEYNKARYEKNRGSNINISGSIEHRVAISCRMQHIDIEDFIGFTNKSRPHIKPIHDCIKMNERFNGSHAHHITKSIIIYIPKELHRHIRHNLRTGYNMGEINALSIQFLNCGL